MTEGASALVVALALTPFSMLVIWAAWKSAVDIEETLDVRDDDRGES